MLVLKMNDFIHDDWSDCVITYENPKIVKNLDKLLEELKDNIFDDPKRPHRTMSKLGEVVVMIHNKQIENWHSDSVYYRDGKLSTHDRKRYWSKITYLTEGSALSLGNWNPSGFFKEDRWPDPDWHLPYPDEILATIYPSPGKTVLFPAFMNHRVEPPMTKDRWTLVEFNSVLEYKNLVENSKQYEELAKRYFREHYSPTLWNLPHRRA